MLAGCWAAGRSLLRQRRRLGDYFQTREAGVVLAGRARPAVQSRLRRKRAAAGPRAERKAPPERPARRSTPAAKAPTADYLPCESDRSVRFGSRPGTASNHHKSKAHRCGHLAEENISYRPQRSVSHSNRPLTLPHLVMSVTCAGADLSGYWRPVAGPCASGSLWRDRASRPSGVL